MIDTRFYHNGKLIMRAKSFRMGDLQKQEITEISKRFASEFRDTIGGIAGSGFLIVDPLSGYLNFCGFAHKLEQIPANERRPLVLIMTFHDGSRFIPAGSDLPIEGAHDWMWI